MSRLVFSHSTYQELHKFLFRDEYEACAILFANSVILNNKLARIVVRDLILPRESDYDHRSRYGVQLKAEFIAKLTQDTRITGNSIVFVHSHPGNMDEFSATDDKGEKVLAEFLNARTPNKFHASLVLTRDSFRARILGKDDSLSVFIVGSELKSNLINNIDEQNIYDRQIRAFGKEGQAKLNALTVGIIGLGGTGSIVAQQLAHLGVKKFLLMDPDILESSNLNRVVGSTTSDLGKDKVVVAKNFICLINPNANVQILKESVINNSSAKKFADTDFIFSCTDSHGSRAIINQFAYQYLVPTIDMGVIIHVQNKKILNIAGRTQLLAPELGCLTCGNFLDPEEIRRDLLTDFERKQDPYITHHEAAPAVISINSTVSSLAVTMFLNTVVGIPGTARLINYNAITGVSRPGSCAPHPTCVVCSRNGSFARADSWQLPGRLN